MRSVRVTSAAESAARDAATIGAGVPSRALMQRAGAAAAAEIARRYADRLRGGVLVYAGPGNNGGDGWVVARALAAVGARVAVVPVGDTRSEDARAERALAEPLVTVAAEGRGALVVDALLGTGSRGELVGVIVEAIRRINNARAEESAVVAIDVPSGIDATTGRGDVSVAAHVTVTFGTLKRGLLAARGRTGRIVVLDIGLVPAADDLSATLADAAWVRARVPPIDPNAHKGSRRRLLIAGGAVGMAGAPMLAARAAMRSGIGMVRLLVADANVATVQTALPYALARAWPVSGAGADEWRSSVTDWAHGVLLGPGLGNTSESRALVERLLGEWQGPVVLDADALNVFAGDVAALFPLLAGRPALLTPHVSEFARLVGSTAECVEEGRFEIGAELARAAGAAVLLKGVPTVVTSPSGERVVSAAGTPALAAAGSGDLLAGIAATLLTQGCDSLAAGACAAWLHGRAAEIAGSGRDVRGVSLADVEDALAHVWSTESTLIYPVIAELPPLGVEDE